MAEFGVGIPGSPTCDRCGEGNARFPEQPGYPAKPFLALAQGAFPSNPMNGQPLCILFLRREPARGPAGTCPWSDTWQGAEWEQVAPKGLLEAHTCDLGTAGQHKLGARWVQVLPVFQRSQTSVRHRAAASQLWT